MLEICVFTMLFGEHSVEWQLVSLSESSMLNVNLVLLQVPLLSSCQRLHRHPASVGQLKLYLRKHPLGRADSEGRTSNIYIIYNI